MRRARLSNRDIALIIELETELRANSRVKPNFWWAVGQVFGMEPDQVFTAVREAKKNGMNKREAA